jgi:ABC-type nitrate/sulfonate/bicarbonate transport system substrate-binding protein
MTMPQELRRLRIGLSPTDVSSGPLYAEAAGAFARHGIEPDFQTLPLNYAHNLVLEGEMDVAFADITSVIQLIEETGARFKILAGAAVFDAAEPVNVLIAPKNRPVRSGADLNGKRGGVPRLRSFGELATRNWVDQNGGDSTTLTFIELPFTEFETALNDGRIDVGPISEPLKTMFAPNTSFVGVSYAAIAQAFVFAVFVARRGWTEAQPGLAASFTAAMNEGNAWANTHRAETAEILTARYSVPAGLATTMARARFPEKLTPDLIQPVLDLAKRYGFGRTTDAAALLS